MILSRCHKSGFGNPIGAFIRGQDDEDVTDGWISQTAASANGKYPSPILLEEGGLELFLLMVADETHTTPDPENNP